MSVFTGERLSPVRRAAIWLGGVLQDAGNWLNTWGWSK